MNENNYYGDFPNCVTNFIEEKSEYFSPVKNSQQPTWRKNWFQNDCSISSHVTSKGFTFCFVLRFRILSFTLITKRSFPSGFSHQLLHSRTTGDFWVKTFLDIYSLLKPCRRTLSSTTKNCWKGSNDSSMTFPSFRAESMRFLMQRFAMFNRFNLSTLHWASRLLSGVALELNVLTKSFPKFSSVSSSSKLADAILFFSLRNRWLSR